MMGTFEGITLAKGKLRASVMQDERKGKYFDTTVTTIEINDVQLSKEDVELLIAFLKRNIPSSSYA